MAKVIGAAPSSPGGQFWISFEFDVPDHAARWLRSVERNQAQRRQRAPEPRSFGATQVSSL